MAMCSRERVLAALKREEPDRVPYCELAIDRAFAAKLMGWKEATTRLAALGQENPFTIEEAKEISSALGLDNLPYVLRQPIYAHMPAGKDGRAFSGEGMIRTEADLSMVKLPDPHKDEFYAEAEAFVKQKEDYAAFFVTRIGLAPTILSMGIQHFALSLYDNRHLVERLLDIYFDWMVVVAERVCQMGFDVFATTDDFAFKTGLLFSPASFRELVMSRYQRVLEKVTIPWVLHSDGNITEAIDILIDLGVAAIHPIEKGAMDIRTVKQKYGTRVCLIGNLDLNILAGGIPEEADREVRGLIRDVGRGGGYILSSGNSLASFLNPECVRAMAQAVKKYGHYPIQLS